MFSTTGAAELGEAQARGGRREEVLDQASRRLNAAGVSLGSLAEIAGELGITRAALYGYVADRQDLVFQCYRRSCEIMGERLSAASAEADTPFGVVAGFISNVLDPARPEAAALSEPGCLTAEQQALVGQERDALVARLAQVIADGQRAGAVRALDPDVAGHAILSLVFWIKLAPRWLAEEATLPRERLQRAAESLLFEGMTTGPVEIPYGQVDLGRLIPRLDDAFDRKAVAAAKLERMLAAASRLFNQRGVDTTSMDDIAAELKVSKRTIYNHFSDKQALLSACQLRGYRIFTDIADQAKAWPGSAAEALGAATYASVLASFRPELSPLRVFSGLPDLPADRRALAAAATARLQQAYTGLFHRGLEDGSLKPLDVRPAQLAMAGLSGWVGMSGTVEAERVARELAQLTLVGLAASKEQAG